VAEELIDRYRIHIFGRCLHLTGSHEDAEDLQQEAIENLLNWLNTEERCTHFSALVFRVSTNKSIDFMRRKARYRTVLGKIERKFEKSEANFVQNTDLVRLTLEKTEQEIEVRAKLRDLPDFQRRCIEAFYFEQLSYRQIAETVSKPVNEVRNALQVAKRKLRKLLTKT
jgi:RNA polymerase sigma factor (sigma-70 family)